MSIFILTAPLPRAAELRTTQDSKKVLSFSLPDQRGWGDKKKTEWIQCSMWGERAEKLAQHLTKGLLVTVYGEISADVYKDKPQLKLFVNNIELHGGGRKDEPVMEGGGWGSNPSIKTKSKNDLDDDIPF